MKYNNPFDSLKVKPKDLESVTAKVMRILILRALSITYFSVRNPGKDSVFKILEHQRKVIFNQVDRYYVIREKRAKAIKLLIIDLMLAFDSKENSAEDVRDLIAIYAINRKLDMYKVNDDLDIVISRNRAFISIVSILQKHLW